VLASSRLLKAFWPGSESLTATAADLFNVARPGKGHIMMTRLARLAPRLCLGVVFVAGLLMSGPVFAKTVLQAAEDAGAFTVFLKAVKEAGLTQMLSGEGPFTLFAPTDDAFTKLPRGSFDVLLKASNKEKLKAFVGNHIVNGIVTAYDMRGRRREAVTIYGGTLLVDGTQGLKVENAKITRTDIAADNGVVHVIDTALVPR
jgi:uncharacterized surface protein with fasciclin (FAS1) repeats